MRLLSNMTNEAGHLRDRRPGLIVAPPEILQPRRNRGADLVRRTLLRKGVWLADGETFELDLQTLGNDDAATASLTFAGKSLELKMQSAGSSRFSLMQGQSDD